MSLVDIFKKIIDLVFIPINKMFDIYIPITDKYTCSLGVLFIAVLTLAYVLSIIFEAVGIKGDDE